MKLALALALLPGVSAQQQHMLGADGHGIWNPSPACCSVSTAEDCVRTHPCRAAGETDVEAVHEAFMTFLTKFEKSYETVEEWAHRLTVFAQNAKVVLAPRGAARLVARGHGARRLESGWRRWTPRTHG